MATAQARILKRLEETRNAAAERVLEAALSKAGGAEQEKLARLLVKRDRRPGWVALIRQFDRMSVELQDVLLEHPRELFGPLAEAISEGEGSGRANVIDIIRKACDSRLVLLLIEALSDVRLEVRAHAAESFSEAIRSRRIGGSNDDQTLPDEKRMRRAVEFALKQFGAHRQEEIVTAALLFERMQDGTLWPMFSDPHADASRVAAGMLRNLVDPGLAAAAFLALTSPLKVAAVAGLSNVESAPVTAGLARESYRCVDPMVGRGMAVITHCKMLETVPEEMPWNDQDQWLGWLRLVEVMNVNERAKLTWYRKMVETAPAGAQGVVRKLLLIGALGKLENAEAIRVIGMMAGDAEARVARSVERALHIKRNSERHQGQGVAANLRRVVSGAATAGQFEKTWAQFPELPPMVKANTSRKLSVNDAQFNEALKVKLASENAQDLGMGLRMLLSLPKVVAFRDQIIVLCGHADARVVATAVKLLGRLEDPRLGNLLEAAARHADPRVRANAVESMEELKIADKSTQVLALLHSRNNRERANAIRAISTFDFTTARACLIRMLNDENAHHRLSALWVVGQLGMLDMVRQVASTARLESNPRVRKAAREMMAQLSEAAAVQAVRG